MSFNLKALGLALLAALAMSAFAASAAYATEEGHVVADEDAVAITSDTDAAGHGFVFATHEGSTECTADHFVGALNENPTKTITVDAGFGGPLTEQECMAGGFPSTVTNNGCELHFDTFETDGVKSEWESTVDLTCPDDPIEVHVYLGSNHEVPVCTQTIPAQSGLEGVTFDTNESKGVHDLTLTADVGGITATQHEGIGCPDTHFTDATMKGSATVQAIDAGGEPVDLTIEHTE